MDFYNSKWFPIIAIGIFFTLTMEE